MPQRVLITGAAGFIGSHLVDRLLARGCNVTAVDNLIRGDRRNLAEASRHPAFQFLEADLADLGAYRRALDSDGCVFDVVWHMAANSDIGAGVADANVDHRDTFLTTFNTLQIMREFRIPRIAFASTSAIYGDLGRLLTEDAGPLFPISNYGAMKLASEACISAALESFLDRAWIFRFPNVIGPRATHGIIYDLLHKIARKPEALEVLGNGLQQKPYLHVTELIDAMLLVHDQASERLNYFNVGPTDEGVQVRFIAETVIQQAASKLPICYTGGEKGWIGDVPKFEYSIDKIKRLGWRPAMTSAETVQRAVAEIHSEFLNRCSL